MIQNEEVKLNGPTDPHRPPRWALAILSVLMIATYLGLQLVIALAVVAWRVATHQPIAPEALVNSESFIWVNLVSGAMGAAATVCLALIWPRAWRLVTSKESGGLAGWLGWERPLHFNLWLVPVITLPFMLLVVLGITQLVGEAKVDTQLLLFTTPSLRIVTSIVVSTIIPLAEELMFRGALYNVLLPARKDGMPEWRRQALPLIVTSLLFASVHLLAGFETPAALIQVTILSFYLGGLRAVSGSVKPSVAGHVTWNLVSALFLATNLSV